MNLGSWISNKTKKPFYARKEFHVAKQTVTARAWVCGLGQFNFYINGCKVGDHLLDPGWTNYNKLVQYVSFPITGLVKAGQNAAAIEVGNGWYLREYEHYSFSFPAFMPPNPNPYQPFGGCLTAAIKIEISYEDGTYDVITTDETWKTAPHPVTMSNVYGSETMDGRLKKPGWNDLGFSDQLWANAQILEEKERPKGVLVEQSQPSVIGKYTYQARHLHSCGNREIYDLTQNMSGMLHFQVKGKRGDVIRVYPAEKLGPDGDVDQMAKNWIMIDSVETYIIGEDDVWEAFSMTFTYFAGRYLAVEGACRKAKEGPVIRNMTAEYITSNSRDTGSFSCDDKRYEQIYELVLRAVECNLLSVHTDCPQIERFAWQEQNHLMAPSIMFMKDVSGLWKKILADLRQEQCQEGDWFLDHKGERFYPGKGLVPSQAPCYEPNVLPVEGIGSFFDTIAWGSACILAPYWHYLYYGDQGIIEENYEMGKNYLEYLQTRVNEEGFINHGLGDWGNPKEGCLARENVETAFLYGDLKVMAQFAGILGREREKQEYLVSAKALCSNYNEKLLVKHPEKGYYCYRNYEYQDCFQTTQACQALPLYWGMTPQDKRADVSRALKEDLLEEGAFVSGEIGLPYIIQAMSRYHMRNLICSLLLKETHPSYYAFVLQGETTLGEYWETNPRSHCHDMMGSIVEWYYNGIGGIQIEAPGCKKIRISPYLPESMKECRVSYESVQGTIEVHLQREGTQILASVRTPAAIEWVFEPETPEIYKLVSY